MKSVKIIGETHTFNPPENWQPEHDGECGNLSVRQGTYGTRALIENCSAWRPSLGEIATLKQGGVVIISIVGAQPLLSVSVEGPQS